MKPATIIAGLCVVIVILAFLQIRGCQAGPSHVVEAQSQDSMMRSIADSVRLLQTKTDSFIILRKDHVIDSLIPLVNMARSAVNAKGHQIAGTIAAGQEARTLRDTVKILSNCDSLVEEVQSGAQLVGGYEYLTDSLINALKTQRRIQDSVSALYLLANYLLQGGLDSSNARYQNLYKDYSSLQKSAGRRWSVGPGGGLMLIGGQIKASAGITLHYDLFKF